MDDYHSVEQNHCIFCTFVLFVVFGCICSYILIPPPDNSWGQELDDGEWDGPIGMLTRKVYNISIYNMFVASQGTLT